MANEADKPLRDQAAVLSGPAVTAAPMLLGSVLRHRCADGEVAVRITEVEAYSGDGTDPAAHTHNGPTARNQVMFGPPGRLYIYLSYGMHWCANVVCSPPEAGEAVLLRAGEIVGGLDLARLRRPAARRDIELARGPARLTRALGLTGARNGADLLAGDSSVRLDLGAAAVPTQIRRGTRVGISKAIDLPWRFWLDREPTVSRLNHAS